MSAFEDLKKEITRLHQQLNENDYSESELEEQYIEANIGIEQLSRLCEKILDKHIALQEKNPK